MFMDQLFCCWCRAIALARRLLWVIWGLSTLQSRTLNYKSRKRNHGIFPVFWNILLADLRGIMDPTCRGIGAAFGVQSSLRRIVTQSYECLLSMASYWKRSSRKSYPTRAWYGHGWGDDRVWRSVSLDNPHYTILTKRLYDHLETRLSPLELLMKVYPKWFKKAYWPTSNLEEETSIGTWNQ